MNPTTGSGKTGPTRPKPAPYECPICHRGHHGVTRDGRCPKCGAKIA